MYDHFGTNHKRMIWEILTTDIDKEVSENDKYLLFFLTYFILFMYCCNKGSDTRKDEALFRSLWPVVIKNDKNAELILR